MAPKTEFTEENESIPDKLAQVEAILSDYEKRIGLSKLTAKEPNLSITREEIMAMHPEDIDGLRWEYSCYALYLEKELGKHRGRYLWSNTNLTNYTNSVCDDYPGFKWEERQSKVLSDSIYAQKLDKLRLNSKMVLERLSFITNKIQFLSDLAGSIAYSKRKANE